ncbi:MAG: cytochrome o ubiquinol oxidase subunit III [Candidatus Saccharimonadales bacterium]
MSTHTARLAEKASKASLGFWLYLMTDILVFASLFATYVILRGGTNGGPDAHEIFNLNSIIVSTAILLISSLTSGLAYLAFKNGRVEQAVLLLCTTIILGVGFITLELVEFSELIMHGHGPAHSAFLSAFFTLVGTHGLHILVGIIWAAALVDHIVTRGANPNILRKLSLFTVFWHFLDLVWIFIFTIVYLLGVLS